MTMKGEPPTGDSSFDSQEARTTVLSQPSKVPESAKTLHQALDGAYAALRGIRQVGNPSPGYEELGEHELEKLVERYLAKLVQLGKQAFKTVIVPFLPEDKKEPCQRYIDDNLFLTRDGGPMYPGALTYALPILDAHCELLPDQPFQSDVIAILRRNEIREQVLAGMSHNDYCKVYVDEDKKDNPVFFAMIYDLCLNAAQAAEESKREPLEGKATFLAAAAQVADDKKPTVVSKEPARLAATAEAIGVRDDAPDGPDVDPVVSVRTGTLTGLAAVAPIAETEELPSTDAPPSSEPAPVTTVSPGGEPSQKR